MNLISLILGKLFVSHCAPLSWWTEEALNHTATYPLSNSSRVALTSWIHVNKFNETLQQTGKDAFYKEISDDTILLETELDSLGFAILVALLEEELDYDPFQLMDEPIYPSTFGEFVAIFEKYKGLS